MDLTPFTTPTGEQVRALIGEDGGPLFVAADVARVLGYSETAAMVRRLDDDEKLEASNLRNPQVGGRAPIVITESGLYAAILGSRVEGAKAFKRWITTEVLPAIRKHGGYLTPAAAEQALTDPDFIIRLATTLKEERAARLTAETALAVAAPKATKWDAFLGLDGYVSLNDAAKALAKAGCILNGRPVGRNRLMEWLRDRRHLNADNTPSQRQVEAGRFVLFTGSYSKPDGEHVITTSTKVTPRGLDWLHGLLVADAEGEAA